jgi:hypothetical protein
LRTKGWPTLRRKCADRKEFLRLPRSRQSSRGPESKTRLRLAPKPSRRSLASRHAGSSVTEHDRRVRILARNH